ncbi:MAG: ArsR family transcriptional regulator [Gemmatimonadales bacterium]|nr:MAG: ArsR family transcriptional regulator [Gemmatimonadales bacterium]
MPSPPPDVIHASDRAPVVDRFDATADSTQEVGAAMGPNVAGPPDVAGSPPLSLDEAAAVGRALGHPVRLRILTILGGRDECFCGDLCREFDLAQSTISQHLKVLREAGLVNATPCGTAMGYCIDGSRVDRYRHWLQGMVASRLP